MTKGEAIKILGQYDVSDLHFYTTEGEEIPFTEWSDAIEMAISALQAQDLQPTCNQLATDCVSRQAAIDAAIEATDDWDGKIKYDRSGWNKAIEDLPSAQQEQQHGRVFKGIVVEYPLYSAYPEYIGKPYFSIKYTENGQEFIGYGTYKPDVLSEDLIDYFMPSAQPTEASCWGCNCPKMERLKEKKTFSEMVHLHDAETHSCDTISRQAAIEAFEDTTFTKNAIRRRLSELPPAQSEQRWIPCKERLPEEDNWLGGSGKQFSDHVLISILNSDDEDEWVNVSCTIDGKWTFELPRHCKILAWMPLPEPYGGEQE